MSSFYGGRQGNSFSIVAVFPSKQAMIQEFKKGSDSVVHFDEYVAIIGDSTYPEENGNIYRRGYKYTDNSTGGAELIGNLFSVENMSNNSELIDLRTGLNNVQYLSAGEAVRTQIDQASQYRAGVNAQYSNYDYCLYKYIKEGTFYATQYDNSSSATIRRWSDLPDLENDFIITNSRYGDDWILQTAVQANSPDVFYRRVVPRSTPDGGYPSGGYVWRKVGDNFSQYRAGINGQSATYNRHAYAYKKDGTFYVTPANWDDLPTSDSPYVITNARYGSWIMQTAVRTANPEDVFTRFVAGTGADDAQYTYSWYKVGGRQDATQFGLPVLALFGDTSGMSKTNAVSLTFRTKDKDGNEITGSSGSIASRPITWTIRAR